MCLKKTYVSKKDAKKAIRLLKKLGNMGVYKKGVQIKRARLRSYKCPRCSEWHLTNQK